MPLRMRLDRADDGAEGLVQRRNALVERGTHRLVLVVEGRVEANREVALREIHEARTHFRDDEFERLVRFFRIARFRLLPFQPRIAVGLGSAGERLALDGHVLESAKGLDQFADLVAAGRQSDQRGDAAGGEVHHGAAQAADRSADAADQHPAEENRQEADDRRAGQEDGGRRGRQGFEMSPQIRRGRVAIVAEGVKTVLDRIDELVALVGCLQNTGCLALCGVFGHGKDRIDDFLVPAVQPSLDLVDRGKNLRLAAGGLTDLAEVGQEGLLVLLHALEEVIVRRENIAAHRVFLTRQGATCFDRRLDDLSITIETIFNRSDGGHVDDDDGRQSHGHGDDE